MTTFASPSLKSAAVVVLLSLSALLHGQGNFAEFPYNPDANGDDFVGTSDLLALLNLYGSEFSEEGLYLNEDSTAAIVSLGSLLYPQCAYQCSQLPGGWRVVTLEDLGMILGQIPQGSIVWTGQDDANKDIVALIGVTGWWSIGSVNSWSHAQSVYKCYCSMVERKQVEYSYCIGAGGENIQPCFDEKKNNGWYPHGSLEFRPDGSPAQGFWRWAE